MDLSVKPEGATERMPADAPIPEAIKGDLARLKSAPKSQDNAIADLMDLGEAELLDDLIYPL
jgi:hypothetical protein